MANNSSLKNLLQSLADAPDSPQKAVFRSLLQALKDSCRLYRKNADYREIAGKAQNILDDILAGVAVEQEQEQEQDLTQSFDEWEEEEFVESGSFNKTERAETIVATQSRMEVIKEESTPSSDTKLCKLITRWNKNNKNWLHLPEVDPKNSQSVVSLILAGAALRSNITSNQFEDQEQLLAKFDTFRQEIHEILKSMSYDITPEMPEDKSQVSGKILHTCRPRITAEEIELVAPAISHNGELVREAVWIIALPIDREFPHDHVNSSLPSHWRGVFGEIDILQEHLKIQQGVFCAMEGINKTRLDPLEKCLDTVLAEVNRRGETFRAIIEKDDETTYRVATDYWRVEECFWSIFHDDDRQAGCSYFDRLRTRMQSWRTTLRRVVKFHIRDFACGNDSLASINQYIGNIILQRKKGVSPGTVVRELRPAIMVKDQATSRVLKGRVIAT